MSRAKGKAQAKQGTRCPHCGYKAKTPRGLSVHIGLSHKEPAPQPEGPQSMQEIVSGAIKALDDEYKRMQKKLERIRKIVEEE